jgi:AcrR family transcriptional regulator
VVREAAAVVDESGWDRLSLAVVAERLGVRLPSLYKHIDSLDGLRRDLAALGMQDLADALTGAAVGRAGADALRAIADAYRTYGKAHPGRYAATVRAAGPEETAQAAAAESLMRVVLAILAGYGLTGDDAIDAARALRATLHGFVTLETGGGFGMPRDVDRSYERLIDGFDATLSTWAAGQPTASGRTKARS